MATEMAEVSNRVNFGSWVGRLTCPEKSGQREYPMISGLVRKKRYGIQCPENIGPASTWLHYGHLISAFASRLFSAPTQPRSIRIENLHRVLARKEDCYDMNIYADTGQGSSDTNVQTPGHDDEASWMQLCNLKNEEKKKKKYAVTTYIQSLAIMCIDYNFIHSYSLWIDDSMMFNSLELNSFFLTKNIACWSQLITCIR